MLEPVISCPHCKVNIKLTESLAAPLVEATRLRFQQQLAQKDREIAIREQGIREKEKQLIIEHNQLNEHVAEAVSAQLKQEKIKIAEEESKKAKQAAALELEHKTREVIDLQALLESRETKLMEAQRAQAEWIKQKRDLEDAKRELDLTIEKQVQAGLMARYEQAKKEAVEEQKFKLLEKEQTIVAMQKHIEELKRRAEQGSQQLQGEVQELDLEQQLRAKFPLDSVEPVPKGEYGGDILQSIKSAQGQCGGSMLWETKRTKHWSDAWLSKLREDQRAAKAEIAIIVSQVLPKGVETFEMIEGVWVTHPSVALPVAMVLRQSLLELAVARQVSYGQQSKTEMIYQYLTGSRFRQRVEAIVEAFSTMQEDLDRERKAIMKQWAKREEQIMRVMGATVGMYGDLQGIAGKSLQEIAGLEMPLLDASEAHGAMSG